MEFSDANPVQLWPKEKASFNNKIEIGVEHKDYFQPFNFEDEIKLQGRDSVLRGYKLTILDCEGEILHILDFTSELVGSDYIYSVAFIPAVLGITNARIKLRVSYFSTVLAGGVTNYIQEVEGTVEFFYEVFTIEGAVENLLQEVDEGIINILTELGLSNNSLDIQITDVWVDGVAATLTAGSLPLGTGSGATMTTKQTGASQSVQVFYTSIVPDQKIIVTDSDGNVFCQSSNSGSPLIFPGCIINPGEPVSIEAADGNCI